VIIEQLLDGPGSLLEQPEIACAVFGIVMVSRQLFPRRYGLFSVSESLPEGMRPILNFLDLPDLLHLVD